MKKTIVLLPGDGIGPEVTRAAASVLRECAKEFDHQFDFEELPVGGSAIDDAGTPLPASTLDACRKADAVFLGAVGGPKWDSLPVGKRPESGLLDLRKGMGLYVNVRPVKVWDPLRGISPLKSERLGDLDLEIVRELAGGIYFGERGNVTEQGVERAWDTESYSTPEIERVAAFAYTRAEERSRRLCSVDKANVLTSSQLWRRTVVAMNATYPTVKLEHMYVDNAAMQLTLRPAQLDVYKRQPQSTPTSPALRMERSRLTMVETAMTWSGSVACRMPRKKPNARMANPLPMSMHRELTLFCPSFHTNTSVIQGENWDR